MHAPIRRQDRPHHRREPPHEERRIRLHDEMIRLEPAHVPRPALGRDLAEPHERPHLVRIPPHRLRQPLHRMHLGIRRHLQQVLLAPMRPPDQPIQPGEPLPIPRLDRRLRQRHQRPRHRERPRRRRYLLPLALREQIVRRPDRPNDVGRLHPLQSEGPRRIAPTLPVDLMGKGDRPHAKRSACSGFGANRCCNRALSSSPPGW